MVFWLHKKNNKSITGFEELLHSTPTASTFGEGLEREGADGQVVISKSTLFLGYKTHQNTCIIRTGADIKQVTSCSSKGADGITGGGSLIKQFSQTSSCTHCIEIVLYIRRRAQTLGWTTCNFGTNSVLWLQKQQVN